MNKQSGENANPSYFTAIINMLIADGNNGAECDYCPMALTAVTLDGAAVRTLSEEWTELFRASSIPSPCGKSKNTTTRPLLKPHCGWRLRDAG